MKNLYIQLLLYDGLQDMDKSQLFTNEFIGATVFRKQPYKSISSLNLAVRKSLFQEKVEIGKSRLNPEKLENKNNLLYTKVIIILMYFSKIEGLYELYIEPQ